MKFNVLNEPWIPVQFNGHSGVQEAGVREILLHAHKIHEVASENPLETISINRMLLAFVVSAFPGLSEEESWAELWEKGYFPESQLDNYLSRYADRFDLFSEVRPFYQHPKTEAKDYSPLTRLMHAASSGNNATLFSHDMDSVPRSMTPAEAARALVSAQSTSLGGGVAKPFNLSHAPLVMGAVFWLRGTVSGQQSLFHALLLNAPPSSEVWGSNDAHDMSTWESDQPPLPRKRSVNGLRDLLTFQSRRLQLIAKDDSIVGVKYNQGSKIESMPFHDPHFAYKSRKDEVLPFRLSAGRALWRDSSVYMMSSSNGQGAHAPRCFEVVSAIKKYLKLTNHEALSADVYGMVSDKAKMELWRRERVTIYPEIINNADRWKKLDSAVQKADEQAKKLQYAIKAFASRLRLNKHISEKCGDVERKERDEFANTLKVEHHYWPALGLLFNNFLSNVASNSVAQLPDVLELWEKNLDRVASESLQAVIEPFALDARGWQAASEAEMVLHYKPTGKTTKTPKK